MRSVLCALACLLVTAGASAQDVSPVVAAMLTAMDHAGVHDEAPHVADLSAADQAALSREILARVTHPHGSQSGAGPSIAYTSAARTLPNGGAIGLALLSRRWRTIPREMPAAFDGALDAIDAHPISSEACTWLTTWIQHPPAALFAGRHPAIRVEAVALVVSACPSPPLADIVRVCNATIGTECDGARVRAGDPTRTNELVAGGLALPTTDLVAAGMNRWGMLASAFGRAGDRAPVDRLLPLLTSPVVLHVAAMFADGPSGGSTTYADVGVADLFVALAVRTWHLPVHFALTSPGALGERVYTAAERDEVRRLVAAHH